MTPFFSIISVQTNSYSHENVAVGLIVVADKIYFDYSTSKLNFLKKLIDGKSIKFLAETNLKKIAKSVKEKNSTGQTKLLDDLYSLDYFEYLNQYAAGALAFSAPKMLKIEFDNYVFAQYYQKMIGEALSVKKQQTTSFKIKIKTLLYDKQIEDKADINYTLKANNISGVLKNTNVSLITVNGSINCLQALDWSTHTDTIVKHIYETQIIAEGLNQFGKIHDKKVDKIKLAIEVPSNKKQKMFFDKIYMEKKELFDFYEYEQVKDFATTISKSDQYNKFSDLISS